MNAKKAAEVPPAQHQRMSLLRNQYSVKSLPLPELHFAINLIDLKDMPGLVDRLGQYDLAKRRKELAIFFALRWHAQHDVAAAT